MPSDALRRRPPAPPRGFSLLEVMAAVALVGVALVSSLELVRDGMDLSVESDRRQLLANYAVSQIEQRLGLVADGWTTGTFSGDHAADGQAGIRHETVCSDLTIDGGSPGLLMDVRTTVYFDEDGDDTLDADELSCQFRTKVGRFFTYEALTP